MASRYVGTNVTVNPLLDLDFMNELHHVRMRKTYARVIALNTDEEPLETLEGIVTQGSANIDGASSVRRTCNLTMVVHELNIHEYYWGLKTKIELWTGLANEINDKYPDIIWFKQGTFVLTSFNTSQSLGNYTVNLQGKDKMTLLNGELGGVVTSLTWDFGTVKVTDDDGSTHEEDLLLKEIVTDAVHAFAHTPFYKIHVNDLDDMGLELLEYRGADPMYLIRQVNADRQNLTTNKNTPVYRGLNRTQPTTVSDSSIVYDPLFDLEQVGVVMTPTRLYDANNNVVTIAKLEYGMTAGYRLTDLTYAGDLILNVGETITSLLDKIVAMLGEYEYFFDLNGDFWFQRKQVYLKTTWNNIKTNEQDEKWSDPNAYTSDIAYTFTDGQLITQYQNSPNFANIRNDYSIWGTRKGVTGKELPIHLRFAIDDKPVEYINYEGVKFTTRSMTEEEKMQDVMDRLEAIGTDEALYLLQQLNTQHSELYELLTEFLEHRNNKVWDDLEPLPDGWWSIFDWANLWEIVVGYIPTERMSVYSRSRVGDSLSDFSTAPYFYNGSNYSDSTTQRWKLIHANSSGQIISTQHSTGCSHPYSQWYNGIVNGSDNIANKGDYVWIWDPVLPDELQTIVDDVLSEDFETIHKQIVNEKLRCGLDWREIIYQMMLDYKKHHTEDDFYLTVYKNNPYTCHNGMTGYEQYYTDLDGFWRELYNPFYEGHYDLVGMSKAKYNTAVKTWYNNTKQEFPYFYGEPKYVQCTTSDPFRTTMQYYTQYRDPLTSETKYKAERPGKLAYEANPTLYWYKDPDGKENIINCVIIEPLDDTKYWFKYDNNSNTRGNGYLQNETIHSYSRWSNNAMTEEHYKTMLKTYNDSSKKTIPTTWEKLKSVSLVKCFVSNPIQTYYTYYYYENGKETRISGAKIDRTDYFANPGKYWRYESIYIQCVEGEKFNTDQDYYVKGQASRTDEEVYSLTKMVTQSAFDAEPTRYYKPTGRVQKILCYSLNLPDDWNGVLYYDYDVNEETFTISDVINNFNGSRATAYPAAGTTNFPSKKAITTTLNTWLEAGHKPYAIYGNFVPIVHPLEYDHLLPYYVFGNDKYNVDGWAPYVSEEPQTLNFWFDFLDEHGELSKYSVQAIGDRPKAVNDTNVKAIYFRETPTIIFVDSNSPEQVGTKLGYEYVMLPDTDLTKLFTISAQGKSAKTVLDGMIYDFAVCAEQITFTTMPYYNLEPNKRIFVTCPESAISGEYILTRYTVPLGPSGTMSVTATLAVDALY